MCAGEGGLSLVAVNALRSELNSLACGCFDRGDFAWSAGGNEYFDPVARHGFHIIFTRRLEEAT